MNQAMKQELITRAASKELIPNYSTKDAVKRQKRNKMAKESRKMNRRVV